MLGDVRGAGCCGRGVAPPLRVHPLRNSLRSFASPSLCEGEDFSATPVIPADAGIQGHKNNRLPSAPWPPRSAFAGAAWVPASAGMTWLSRAVIAVSTVGCRSHAHPLRVHPLRNSLRSFAPPSLREGEDFSATPVIPADAGIQGHKNNRLPRAALVGPVRCACAAWVCVTLGSRVPVVAAGMTWLPRESRAASRHSRGRGNDIRTTVYLAPLWLARSACAGAACFVFTLGSRVRGNDVAVAGMTEVSPE